MNYNFVNHGTLIDSFDYKAYFEMVRKMQAESQHAENKSMAIEARKSKRFNFKCKSLKSHPLKMMKK